jgi:hypothetical protein
MTSVLKAVCLLLYAAALLGTLVQLSPELTADLRSAALILIGAHVLEVPLAFRHIRRYPGPLSHSIALSLAFGLVHWWPLRAARNQ